MTKLPDSDLERSRRRGCFVMLAALLLALLAIGYLATQTSDTQESREALQQGIGSTNAD